MNAFYEHHEHSIRASYRCFDRILLNGLIQPFQQPERVIGFFSSYRNQFPVSRKVLTEIADQFHGWVKNRAEKWGTPIVEAPAGRRGEFVEPMVVAFNEWKLSAPDRHCIGAMKRVIAFQFSVSKVARPAQRFTLALTSFGIDKMANFA